MTAWEKILLADAAAIAGAFLLGPRFLAMFGALARARYRRRLRRGRKGWL